MGPHPSEAATPPPELEEAAPSSRGSTSAQRAAPSAERRAPAARIESSRPVQSGIYVERPLPELAPTGDLSSVPVAQILSTIHLDQLTGMLDLTHDGVHRRVYVVEGRPTFMQSNAERENVGALLLRRGRINEQDFQRCRRYMTENRRTLQQSLLDLKLVNGTELATAYKLLAGQLLPNAVGMSSGTYNWRETDAFVGRVPEGRFDPLEILFRGVANHVHPPQIFAFFAGREDAPIYRTRRWDDLKPAFDRAFPNAGRLLESIDGTRTLRGLSKMRGTNAGEVMPPLFGLVASGMAALPEGEDFGLEAAVHAAANVDDDEDELDLGLGGDGGSASDEDRRARTRIENFHEDLHAKSFFEIFAATPDTSVEAIKSEYFALAKKWHVDAFAGKNLGRAKPKLEEIFARITEAYDTITNPEKRSEYLLFLDRKAKGLPTDVAEILRGEQLYDQAAAMMRRRDHRGAREVLEEAVRLNPDPLYFATLGWVIYQAAPDDDRAVVAAVGNIKKAVGEQENLPLAYQYLGSIAFRREQYGEARKWWSRCIEWEPDNIEANRGLRMVAQRAQASQKSGLLGRIRGKK